MLTRILFIVFTLLPAFLYSQRTPAEQEVLERYAEVIEADLESDSINGTISIAVMRGDVIIWAHAFGPLDPKSQLTASSESIYRTGSISKTITAYLMLKLIDEGHFKLDDKVETYFPDIRELEGYGESRQITFRQLASHTSGLIREPKLKDAATGPIEKWEEKILESIPATSFKTNPGEKYSYSNIGYGILGLAISRAAGKPFMELIEEKVFKELNMNMSFFEIPEEWQQELATGMGGGKKHINLERPAIEHSGRGYKVPNGGIYSNPTDLCKFMISCFNKTLLTPENHSEMQSQQTPEGGNAYGLGFGLDSGEGYSTAGHGGSVSGYSAHFKFDVQTGYGVAVMRNYNQGETNLGSLCIEIISELNKAGR